MWRTRPRTREVSRTLGTSIGLFLVGISSVRATGGGDAEDTRSSDSDRPPSPVSQRVPYAVPPFLSCGDIPFRANALRRPGGYERRHNPAAVALRNFLREHAEGIGQPRRGWFLLARRENYIQFAAGRLPELGAMDFERRTGRWTWVGSGDCEPRAYRKGRAETVTWRRAFPKRKLSGETTRIPVLVEEDSCASGRDAAGRILAPRVHYGQTRVTVTYFIRPARGPQTCQGGPPQRPRFSSRSRSMDVGSETAGPTHLAADKPQRAM